MSGLVGNQQYPPANELCLLLRCSAGIIAEKLAACNAIPQFIVLWTEPAVSHDGPADPMPGLLSPRPAEALNFVAL